MASSNIARLGVVFALNTAEFTAAVDKAISENKRLQNSIERDSKSAQKLSRQMQYELEDYGKAVSRVTQLERMLAEGRMKNAAPEIVARLREQARALDELAESSRKAAAERMKAMGGLTPQQQAQIGYQMTDIFTSLAGGQNPLMVLIQQGGQLRDTFGGAGNAFRAFINVLGPAKAIIIAVGAALSPFAYGAYKGAEQMAKLRDELLLTGNIAGQTAGSLLAMGRAIGDTFVVSIGNAREIVSALAASGKFTATSMESVGKAIAKYAQLSGVDGAEAAKKLIPLLDGTANSARQLNSQFNFLTFAQYKQIEALEKSGRLQEAIKLISESLQQSFNRQTRELGTVERAWKTLSDTLSEVKERLLAIGRVDPQLRAAELQAKISRLQYETDPKNARFFPMQETRKRELQQAQDELKFLLRAEQLKIDAARETAEKQQKENAKIASDVATGGREGALARDAELRKARFEAERAAIIQSADELANIRTEYEGNVQKALLDMREKNEKEGGKLSAHNAAMLQQQILKLVAERDKKIGEIEAKRAIEQVSLFKAESEEEQQYLANIAQERGKAALQSAAALQLAQQEAEIENKLLGLQRAGVLTSQTDLEIARMRLQTEREIEALKDQAMYQGEEGAQARAFEERRIRERNRLREDALMRGAGSASEQAVKTQRETLDIESRMAEFRRANIFASEKELEIARIRLDTQRQLEALAKSSVYQGRDTERAEEERRIRDSGTLRENMVNLKDEMSKIDQIGQTVFGHLSGAIDNFVRTGKLSFKDLARSIIQDLIRIQMQAQLTSIFKTFVGSIFGGPALTTGDFARMDRARANGGPVEGNTTYLVGERGPELFVPRSAGTIIPNHAMGMGGVTNVTNNYINAIDVQSFEQRLLGSNKTIWAANQYAQKSLATGRGRT